MQGIGIVGLGRAATALLPSILSHPDVEIVGVCEPQTELREAFCNDFGVRGYADIEALLEDQSVDIAYVASPHQFHRDHTVRALTAGKHVLVEKPMALTLDECDRMIRVADKSGRVLLVGHTNGYDAPILALRELTMSKRYGNLRMINTMNYNDFLYRPRRPEELDTALGGGIMFNQFPHQVEMVRTIAGSRATRVSAVCGTWDETRATEAAVAALIRFDDGVVASVVYSGYAHLDVTQLYRGLDNSTERGVSYSGRRAQLAGISNEEEMRMRTQSGYPERRTAILDGPGKQTPHERFGVLVASFDDADIVPSPRGLVAYTDDGVVEIDVPPGRGGGRRATVIDELCDAIAGHPPIHDGRWARVTLSVCLAALASSASGTEVAI